MTCRNCGAELFSADVVCPACGLRQDPVPDAFPVLPTPPAGAGSYATARSWVHAEGAPYLYGGRWWSRRPNGEVLRFESDQDRWLPPPTADTPFFMRRPKYSSLRTPTAWLLVLFGVYVAVTIGAIVTDINRIDVFGAQEGDLVFSRSEIRRLDAADQKFAILKGIQALCMIVIAPVFIWWTRRATCNVRSFGAIDPRFSPGWAIGWWFVPIAVWWQPFRVLSESWRASDPQMPAEESSRYRELPTPMGMLAWWLTTSIAGVAINAVSQLNRLANRRNEDITAYIDITYLALFSDVMFLVASALALSMIVRMSRRHSRANEKFDLPRKLDSIPA